jgi:NADH-quinone oxidoreductase subunit C
MAIAQRVQAEFPDEVLESYTYQGQTAVVIRPGRVRDILQWLRDTPEIRMNHLRSLCGVDNSRHRVDPNLMRVEVGEEDPVIDSVVSLWPGANWLERETWDLVGIRFTGHPDLRRVLLPDDWEGHPLRKEYPLRGKGEWSGLVDLQAKARELDKHSFDPDNPPPAPAPTRKKGQAVKFLNEEEGA